MTSGSDAIVALPSQHFGEPTNADADRFGAKASGLLSLPAQLVPPFIVVAPTGLTGEQVRGLAIGWLNSVLDRSNALQEATAALLANDGVLLVRSSGLREGLLDRGQLATLECPADLRSLERTIVDSWLINNGSADEIDASIAVVIQRKLDLVIQGHVSNERRVSHRHDSWLLEVFDKDGAFVRWDRITRTSSPANIRDGLRCEKSHKVDAALRTLITLKHGRVGRRHYEWLWTGDRVWVVQCDYESTPKGEPPGHAWTRPAAPAVGALNILVSDDTTTPRWGKVECLRAFRAAGLDAGQVFVLEDSRVILELASGDVRPELEADIEAIASWPIVVRTDTAGELPKLMLPRTETCLSPESVLDWLKTSAAHLLTIDPRGENVCFLFHRFIKACAGSYSYAQPGVPRVRIDCTWGVPDSLLYFPHDSFEVDISRREVTWRKIRCKQYYVDFLDDGSWFEKQAGTPWDWSASVGDADLIQIASDARAIADAEGKSVEVMHFVDVDADTGLPRCLPWFSRVSELATVPDGYAARLPRAGPLVRSPDDLAALRERLDDDPTLRQFLLRPEASYLRSQMFVESIAKLALEKNLVVLLEGSVLSHVFYLLRHAGVYVQPVDHDEPQQIRDLQSFEKLVRDRVPDQIERGGERALIHRANRAEMLSLLKRKAVEEAIELNATATKTDALEEAADVLEVLRAVASILDVDMEEIERRADAKRDRRGGFDGGLVLRGTWIRPTVEKGSFDPLYRVETDRVGFQNLEHMSRTNITFGQEGGSGIVRIRLPRVPLAEEHERVVDLAPVGLDATARVRQLDREIVIEIGHVTKSQDENQLRLFVASEDRLRLID